MIELELMMMSQANSMKRQVISLFAMLPWSLKQGQVIPYDNTKGNWFISKFTKIDKE